MIVNTITKEEIIPIKITGKEVIITPENSNRKDSLNKKDLDFLGGLLDSMIIFASDEEETYMIEVIKKLNNLKSIMR